MDKTYFISQSTSLSLVIIISLIFTVLGLYHSRKFQGINNYLTANRNIGLFSLTTSLVASALGAWILFGPAAASTWGGIGAVIGYALGTAFPMIFLIYLGKKIRNEFPKGSSLIEFMRKKFGKSLFKLILLMTINELEPIVLLPRPCQYHLQTQLPPPHLLNPWKTKKIKLNQTINYSFSHWQHLQKSFLLKYQHHEHQKNWKRKWMN